MSVESVNTSLVS